MINNKVVLAITPARGGSKGIPRKNIKCIAGKELIGWTLESGKQSKYIDHFIVSTDDQEIADVARNFGVEAPFLRPEALAADTSGSVDVILHAMEWMEMNRAIKADIVVMLEPTSPLRDSTDIDQALEQFVACDENESLVGVARVESGHPDFLCKIEDGYIVPYAGERFVFKRRQEIEDCYFFEGSIYISRSESLRLRRSFYHERTVPFILPKWKAPEIDDMVDFLLIERLLELRKNESICPDLKG
jgi:CMP-N,N'-diacetyllegionaminic acid synthase